MWAIWVLVLAWGLAGCGGSGGLPPAAERDALVRALQLLPGDPAGALALCEPLHTLRADCVTAVVESAPDREGLEAWCDALPVGTPREECWFQLAEGRGDLSSCSRAGAFADDCRLHVWTRQLPALWASHPSLAEGVARCRQAMEDQDLDPQDDRYWSAAFRQSMARPPLDRRGCRALEPRLGEACWNTGVAVLNDRMNRLRDFRHVDCAQGLSPEVEILGPDPELEALRDSRWTSEICPPDPAGPDTESP